MNAPPAPYAIDVDRLNKHFGDKHVVKDCWELDLDYAVDGNGSGEKSRPDFWWSCKGNKRELVAEYEAVFLVHRRGKK